MTERASSKFNLLTDQVSEAVFSQSIMEKAGIAWPPQFGWSMSITEIGDQDPGMIYSGDQIGCVDRKVYWSSLFRPGYGLEPMIHHCGKAMCTDMASQFAEEIAIIYKSEIPKLFTLLPEGNSDDQLIPPGVANRKFWRIALEVATETGIIFPSLVALSLKEFRFFNQGISLEDCLDRFSRSINGLPAPLVKFRWSGKDAYFARHWFELRHLGWRFDLLKCREVLKEMQQVLPYSLIFEAIDKFASSESKSVSYKPSWIDVTQTAKDLYKPEEYLF